MDNIRKSVGLQRPNRRNSKIKPLRSDSPLPVYIGASPTKTGRLNIDEAQMGGSPTKTDRNRAMLESE